MVQPPFTIAMGVSSDVLNREKKLYTWFKKIHIACHLWQLNYFEK